MRDRYGANDHVSATSVKVHGNTLTCTYKLAVSPEDELDPEATETETRKNAHQLESEAVESIKDLEKIDGIDNVKIEHRFIDASGATLFSLTYTRDGLQE